MKKLYRNKNIQICRKIYRFIDCNNMSTFQKHGYYQHRFFAVDIIDLSNSIYWFSWLSFLPRNRWSTFLFNKSINEIALILYQLKHDSLCSITGLAKINCHNKYNIKFMFNKSSKSSVSSVDEKLDRTVFLFHKTCQRE